jgi:hypothetical protein
MEEMLTVVCSTRNRHLGELWYAEEGFAAHDRVCALAWVNGTSDGVLAQRGAARVGAGAVETGVIRVSRRGAHVQCAMCQMSRMCQVRS